MLKLIQLSWSCFFLLNFLFPYSTFATLGEPESSIEVQRLSLSSATIKKESHKNYVVHQLKSKEISLTEYSNPNGKVFAVSWFGGVADLKSLLGSYFDSYEAAKKTAPRFRGSRRLVVKTPTLVVEQAGAIRNLRGRAYLPEQLPKDFNETEIR